MEAPLSPPPDLDPARLGQIATATVAVLGALYAVVRWAFRPLADVIHRKHTERVFAKELAQVRENTATIERQGLLQGIIVRDLESLRREVQSQATTLDLIPELHGMVKRLADDMGEVKRTQERVADRVTELSVDVGKIQGIQQQQELRGGFAP
mgnify:CR=1 FL=1